MSGKAHASFGPRFDGSIAPWSPCTHTLIQTDENFLGSDAAFAFYLFVTMLFINQLGTIGAVLFCLLAVAYAVKRAERIPYVIVTRALLLPIPVLAVISTLWSVSPVDTLKYSLELAVTIGIALLFAVTPKPESILRGVFLAFTVHVLLSSLAGEYVGVGATQQSAFAGLSASKNHLADTAATGFIVSVFTLFLALSDRSLAWCVAAFAVAAVQFYLLVEAQSVGAMVGLGIAVLAFFGFVVFSWLARPVRAVLVAILCIGAAITALNFREFSQAAIFVAAEELNKETTLTGRVYLWYRADELIAERPVLGRGYNAFWLQDNPDAEGLWRYAEIDSRSGFNFHNTAVEILVHFGWLGLIVFAVGALVPAARLFRRFVANRNLFLGFWSTLLVYEFARMPIETIGTTPFYFSTVLVFVALGIGLSPRTVVPFEPRYGPPIFHGQGPFGRPAIAR